MYETIISKWGFCFSVWNVNRAFLESLLDEAAAKAGGGGILVYE